MAVLTGVGGSVTFATGIVTGVRQWSVNESVNIRDATTFASGTAAAYATAGVVSFSGSFERIVDSADANILNVAGATGDATFTLATGKTYAGTIIIQSVGTPVPKDDLIIETVQFQGTGARTIATAS